MKKKLLYGLKYESLEEKIKWMLSLSLKERYEYNIGFSEFIRKVRKNSNLPNAKKTFKTIQIIKSS